MCITYYLKVLNVKSKAKKLLPKFERKKNDIIVFFYLNQNLKFHLFGNQSTNLISLSLWPQNREIQFSAPVFVFCKFKTKLLEYFYIRLCLFFHSLKYTNTCCVFTTKNQESFLSVSVSTPSQES